MLSSVDNMQCSLVITESDNTMTPAAADLSKSVVSYQSEVPDYLLIGVKFMLLTNLFVILLLCESQIKCAASQQSDNNFPPAGHN